MDKIKKTLYYINLFDIYSSFLSETQKSVFSDYYIYNLSFSEIAHENNISRSAVEDALKKASEKLLDYESKLKLYERRVLLLDKLDRLDLDEKIKEEIKDIIKDGI